MAVIESKGDGYSLYNGVKLPILPAYNTEKYRYAHIVDMSSRYRLILTDVPAVADPNTGVDSVAISLPVSGVAGATSGFIYKDNIIGANWGTFSEFEWDEGYSIVRPSQTLLWSNYDIINTADNSVHLAASEPISLDGMNVIEWDGDTTGLEAHAANTYYVSNNTDVDASKMGVFVRSSATGALQTLKQNFTIVDNFCHILNTVGCVFEASETLPTVGIYIYAKSGTQRYVSLFAYYPIEEETENSTGKDFLLHQMFSKGIAFELTGKIYWMQ